MTETLCNEYSLHWRAFISQAIHPAAQQCAAPDASSRVHLCEFAGYTWLLSRVSFGVGPLGEGRDRN